VIRPQAQPALADEIATRAHAGVLDKIGEPYIQHPRRVAASFDPITQPVEHCAGLLHDVIEDTDLTADDLLAAGVDPAVVDVVVLMTRREDVADETYYAGIRQHPAALAVKLADIDDNTAPWRVEQLPADKRQRLAEKYRKARAELGADGTN
jgi:(p)ppGpp synthase/HD superfamily hydrolase